MFPSRKQQHHPNSTTYSYIAVMINTGSKSQIVTAGKCHKIGNQMFLQLDAVCNNVI